MKIRLIFLSFFFLGCIFSAQSQSSGTFCVDLNQTVRFAAGKFEVIKGKALSGKTLEYESKMILAGTLSATIKPGPEAGAVHFLSPMPLGTDIVATRSFRDNMIEMTSTCMEAMGYTMKPSKIKVNGEDAFEMTFFSYEFPASKSMKIQIYIVKKADGNSVVLDLMYKE